MVLHLLHIELATLLLLVYEHNRTVVFSFSGSNPLPSESVSVTKT